MGLAAVADTIHRCFRCGYCKYPSDYTDLDACPAYARFRLESFSPGGRLWLLRAWYEGDLEYSERLARVVFSCTACGNCARQCPYRFGEQVEAMIRAGKSEIVERGLARGTVKRFLENVTRSGNPYGSPPEARGDWAADDGVEPFDGQEWLLYVGCVGSYDPTASRVARALAAVLTRAGVSFGILGADEVCDGNEAAAVGEEGLFEHLARTNISLFRERGVKKVLTLSPHAFNAMRNDYPRLGGDFQVVHQSQLLARLLKEGSLHTQDGGRPLRVTFHDPCQLGRLNGEYEAPRRILKKIPGVELVEMPRSRASALCCGGGGGNAFIDLMGGGEHSPARIRVRQARDSGAEVLATACPTCLVMLEDAARSEGLGDALAIRDVSELLAAATA